MSKHGSTTGRSKISRLLDDAPKFIQDLPNSFVKNNLEMIERFVTLLNAGDKTFTKKFWHVVNNRTLNFLEKIERMHELNEECEQRECDAKHRDDMMESLRKMDEQVLEVQEGQKVLEMDLILLEEESIKKKLPKMKPLEKLTDNLVDWLGDLAKVKMDPQDQRLFATKMWQIITDFEDDIKQEEKGFKIVNKRLIEFYQKRQGQIQQHYNFRIEALEQALNEMKMRHNREVERLTM